MFVSLNSSAAAAAAAGAAGGGGGGDGGGGLVSGRVHRGMRAISQRNRHTKKQPRVTPLNAQCHISHNFTSFLIFLPLCHSLSLSLPVLPPCPPVPGIPSCRSLTGSAVPFAVLFFLSPHSTSPGNTTSVCYRLSFCLPVNITVGTVMYHSLREGPVSVLQSVSGRIQLLAAW